MSGVTGSVLDLEAIEAVAASVPDPELPVVTLGDLGIVRGVAVLDDGAVEVAITPTYVGCPATEAIAADVRARVSAELGDGREVRTRTVLSPAWSTDWITEDGRQKLAEHGIAPPSGQRAVGGPVAVALMRRPSGAAEDSSLLSTAPHPPQAVQAVACPRCGSTQTKLVSAFGSTPCQSLRACRACGEPFGAIKTL